ncbi:hypothetical protein AKJ16_DCAP06545 [Drosera capensis]
MLDDSHAMLPATLHGAGKNSVVAEDTKLENSLVLNSHVSVMENGSGISTCRAGLLEQNGEFAGLKAPVSDSTNSAAEEDTDDCLIKCIFQWKRKKLPISLDHNDATNGAGKKLIAASEEKEPNLLVESSQDSRWVAQVSRQLIGLSETRWRQ